LGNNPHFVNDSASEAKLKKNFLRWRHKENTEKKVSIADVQEFGNVSAVSKYNLKLFCGIVLDTVCREKI